MNGVVSYIEDLGDEIRLIFDDVNNEEKSELEFWKKTFAFTSNTYSTKEITELSLSKEQFAHIGENLVIRLMALNGKTK